MSQPSATRFEVQKLLQKNKVNKWRDNINILLKLHPYRGLIRNVVGKEVRFSNKLVGKLWWLTWLDSLYEKVLGSSILAPPKVDNMLTWLFDLLVGSVLGSFSAVCSPWWCTSLCGHTWASSVGCCSYSQPLTLTEQSGW